MFSFFKRKQKCAMCKRRTRAYQSYQMPSGRKAEMCLACSEYAERRAYKRL